MASDAQGQSASPTRLMVQVQPLSGNTFDGELLTCDENRVEIKSSSGVKLFAAAELSLLKQRDVSVSPIIGGLSEGKDLVQLVDGSSIYCNEIRGRDIDWRMEDTFGNLLSPIPSMLSRILFRGQSKTIRASIDSVETSAISSVDELVIVRPGDAVDRIPGVILGLDAEAASFSFDGQTIPAPRSKLAGLVWAKSVDSMYHPTIRIKSRDGSRWEATALKWELKQGATTGAFVLKLQCGLQCQLSAENVVSIDYSNAIVRWLASLPILDSKAYETPFLATPMANRNLLLAPYFQSEISNTNASPEFASQNLVFPTDGELTVRVPDGTTRFKARIVRPSDAKVQSLIGCELWMNDQKLWSNDDAMKNADWTVDVKVVPEKKIRMVVKCESGFPAGSRMTWIQPRFSP